MGSTVPGFTSLFKAGASWWWLLLCTALVILAAFLALGPYGCLSRLAVRLFAAGLTRG
jgi:glycine betaine transporter